MDNRQPDKFEFIDYLFKRLVQIYPIPYVVGLTHTQNEEKDVASLRQRFNVPSGIDAFAVKPDDFDSIMELFYQLKEAGEVKEEEKEAKGA